MTETPPPAPRPKMSPVLRVVIVIAGIVAIVGGIMKMKQGFGEMSGKDPEITRLSEESDKAIDEANKHGLEAAPLFQSMLDAVDKDGLDAARAGKKDAAEKARDLFARAAEQFRLAAQKLDEAAARKPNERLVAFFAAKSRGYKGYADARSINHDIARMFLDPSIKTIGELEPKVLEAAKRRKDIEEAAAAAAAEAEKIAAELKK